VTGEPGKLIRIYANEHDQYEGKPLYEAIVDRCRELRLAGVTVFRALEGFGETAELYRPHAFQSDLPIVITIVEGAEKARQAISVLEGMMNSGLIAVTDVDVIAVQNGRVVRWRD
jgi:PII-like signaling protein